MCNQLVCTESGRRGGGFAPATPSFATHNGYQPRACRPHRPETKGKVERPFSYVETNLLNGRTFASLEHLNETAALWLANTADVHVHRETKRRPIDLYQEEKPHLLSLPANYDTAQVLCRTVNSEGHVAYRQNFSSVPGQRIGELLPLRITEKELIVYGPNVKEIARHALYPSGISGEKHSLPEHSPGRDPHQKYELLKQRFAEFGSEGVLFLDALVSTRRCGKEEAARVLGLLATYHGRATRRSNSTRSSGSLPDPLVPRRSIGRYCKKRRSTMKPTKTTTPLRDWCLSLCATLGIPLEGAWLDELLSRAEKESLSHLPFLDLLLGAQADARRERTVARRIREARFADRKTLEGFNWQFNSKAFDRVQIEELASGDFIRRRNNLILVGWSGIGKSHIIQALGQKVCVQGYRVLYGTSAE